MNDLLFRDLEIRLEVFTGIAAHRSVNINLAAIDPNLPVAGLITMRRAAAVVLCAGYLPARRASNVAPMEALWYE